MTTSTKIIIGIVVVILIAIIVWAAWPKKAPPVAAEVLNGIMKAELVAKQGEIDAKEAQIKDQTNKRIASEMREKVWAQKFADMQREKENVKPPTTDKELRDRFIVLGLPPAAPGVCGAGYVCFPTGFGQ
jgi:Sec-independent protein translocase protein TatA